MFFLSGEKVETAVRMLSLSAVGFMLQICVISSPASLQKADWVALSSRQVCWNHEELSHAAKHGLVSLQIQRGSLKTP